MRIGINGQGTLRRCSGVPIGRRNLSDEQKAYLRGKRYQAEKKAQGRPEKLGHNVPVERTSAKLAAEYDVDEKTIRRDADYAEAEECSTVEQFGEARDRRIFDLWLACWTQQEIADDTGVDQGDLSKLVQGFMEIGSLAKNHKASAEHATDFDAPIYNIYRFPRGTGSVVPRRNHGSRLDRRGGVGQTICT